MQPLALREAPAGGQLGELPRRARDGVELCADVRQPTEIVSEGKELELEQK